MSVHTTLSWSLLSSGIVTLLLAYMPYPSLYWGVGLVVLGIVGFLLRGLF